jgi:hypothetical protein
MAIASANSDVGVNIQWHVYILFLEEDFYINFIMDLCNHRNTVLAADSQRGGAS